MAGMDYYCKAVASTAIASKVGSVRVAALLALDSAEADNCS
jgi:hypothetical protein